MADQTRDREGYTEIIPAAGFLIRGCLRCGALVSAEPVVHDRWHEALGPGPAGSTGDNR